MKKLILAVSILGFAGAPAFGQMVEFSAADANSDGSVTLEEATAAGLTWTDEQFTAADTDGSGGLSEEEFKNANAG